MKFELPSFCVLPAFNIETTEPPSHLATKAILYCKHLKHTSSTFRSQTGRPSVSQEIITINKDLLNFLNTKHL